jgi:glycosyltransferase involved in cell wall biosynthesis
MVSKALVVGAYQRKAEEIARLGVELTVLTPPAWRDSRGKQQAEARYTAGYDLRVAPVRCGGSFHLHHYPTLARELARLRPDVLHMDEEPYNLATWLALRAAARLGVKSLFFTWQNLDRRYPPPFRQMEQSCYRMVRAAIAGSESAAAVLRAKGYGGPLAVIPQFGVDPEQFRPATQEPSRGDPGVLRVGYAGGLLPEKGVDLLLRACAGLRGAWRLALAGEGSAAGALRALAGALGVAERVTFCGRIGSAEMAPFYRSLDVLALPSRTLPNWKEQFGRVLIEAMACGVAVVGSDSGEIPRVVGNAGLVFAEDDADALRAHLQRLLDDPAARRALAEAGRARVLERFTMAQVAAQTVEVYHAMLDGERQP